jgi:hypothetical protein
VALSKTVRSIKSMNPRTSIKLTELCNLGFLNVEDIMKQLCSNHAHKIFNNACPSYLKNNLLKINEHHKQNTASSRFNYLMLKIKSIESITFYCNVIQDWNLLHVWIESIV